MFRILFIAAVVPLGAPVGGRAQEPPALEVTALGTTDGHARLAWTPAPGTEDQVLEFELQGADSPTFDDPLSCYLGPGRASFRSGLPEGTRHYRVRQRSVDPAGDWSPWSATTSVNMQPYPLRTAWSLFAMGAVLVCCIVGYLIWQGRDSRQPSPPPAQAAS